MFLLNIITTVIRIETIVTRLRYLRQLKQHRQFIRVKLYKPQTYTIINIKNNMQRSGNKRYNQSNQGGERLNIQNRALRSQTAVHPGD